MPLKVVLCGPPGMGKTTIARRIRVLHSEMNVIEFEELCSNDDERIALMQYIANLDHNSDLIMTCANVDVPVLIKFGRVQVVLLWTEDKARYSARTEERDRQEKRDNQNHEHWYDMHKENFRPFCEARGYWLVDTFENTTDQCVEWIIQKMKEANEKR